MLKMSKFAGCIEPFGSKKRQGDSVQRPTPVPLSLSLSLSLPLASFPLQASFFLLSVSLSLSLSLSISLSASLSSTAFQRPSSSLSLSLALSPFCPLYLSCNTKCPKTGDFSSAATPKPCFSPVGHTEKTEAPKRRFVLCPLFFAIFTYFSLFFFAIFRQKGGHFTRALPYIQGVSLIGPKKK